MKIVFLCIVWNIEFGLGGYIYWILLFFLTIYVFTHDSGSMLLLNCNRPRPKKSLFQFVFNLVAPVPNHNQRFQFHDWLPVQETLGSSSENERLEKTKLLVFVLLVESLSFIGHMRSLPFIWGLFYQFLAFLLLDIWVHYHLYRA